MIPLQKVDSLESSRRASSATPKTKIDLKIVIMGHGGVGKTSLINRYIHNDFAETVSTIGASFVLKKWKSFYLGIWDTAGQERFTKISTYYCRGAQAAILAYDITDRDSFHALDNYAAFLADADKNCMIVVVGTKLDLVRADPAQRQVSAEEGERYASQQRTCFYETSAKDNLDITAVFDHIGYQCLASQLSAIEAAADAKQSAAAETTPTATLTLHHAAGSRSCCTVQ